MDDMKRQGKLLAINRLYGVRYATPRGPIEKVFREGNFPLLDWPVQNLQVMQATFPSKLFTVYVGPQNMAMLEQHLENGRDPQRKRLAAAKKELRRVSQGKYNTAINYRIVHLENKTRATAEKIYDMYLTAIGERQ